MSRMNDPSMQPEQGSEHAQGLHDVGSQVRQAAHQQYEQIRDTAGEYYQQGREMASEYYQQGREKAMEWQHTIEDSIRQQPIRSCLIAAGIGVLFGFLWRRS